MLHTPCKLRIIHELLPDQVKIMILLEQGEKDMVLALALTPGWGKEGTTVLRAN